MTLCEYYMLRQDLEKSVGIILMEHTKILQFFSDVQYNNRSISRQSQVKWNYCKKNHLSLTAIIRPMKPLQECPENVGQRTPTAIILAVPKCGDAWDS